MKITRLLRAFALRISMSDYLPLCSRRLFVRLGGVQFGKSFFVGQGVVFDSVNPINIRIGNHTTIALRCVILAHEVKPFGDFHVFENGRVTIGNNVFIGAHTIITRSVTIGDNVIIGAGSIVTHDIPSGELWAGNPAHFIKKL